MKGIRKAAVYLESLTKRVLWWAIALRAARTRPGQVYEEHDE